MSSCGRKSVGPTQLDVPAFVEQPALDQFSDMRASLRANGGGRMAEAQNALFLRAAPALRGCRGLRGVPCDRARSMIPAPTVAFVMRIDQDEAAHRAVFAIGIEIKRQRGLHIDRRDIVHVEAAWQARFRACSRRRDGECCFTRARTVRVVCFSK